jgi:hypothetical protein
MHGNEWKYRADEEEDYATLRIKTRWHTCPPATLRTASTRHAQCLRPLPCAAKKAADDLTCLVRGERPQ